MDKIDKLLNELIEINKEERILNQVMSILQLPWVEEVKREYIKKGFEYEDIWIIILSKHTELEPEAYENKEFNVSELILTMHDLMYGSAKKMS